MQANLHKERNVEQKLLEALTQKHVTSTTSNMPLSLGCASKS